MKDLEYSNQYFADNGLTSTSANHVSNLAKEYVNDLQAKLNATRFYDTYIQIIGETSKTKSAYAITHDNFEKIESNLKKIFRSNSLIAWFREGIKYKESLIEKVKGLVFPEWLMYQEIEMPARPHASHEITKEEIINAWEPEKKQRYLSLNAKASTFGKFIHQDGPYSNARKDLNKKLNNPTDIKGSGHDTIVYTYAPEYSADEVDDLFFKLQAEYRDVQKELNALIYEAESEVKETNLKQDEEYLALLKDYNKKEIELSKQFSIWRQEQSSKIQKLKIKVPDSLKDVYDEINGLGKK